MLPCCGVRSINFLRCLSTLREGLVPLVVGMGAKDAVYLLEQAGLHVTLTGIGRVASQSIPAGHKVVKGQGIWITLK